MTETQTVLIVDDDPSICKLLGKRLEAAGYVAKSFPSAESFLESCTEKREGCVILDINLSGMQGTELYEELIRRGIRIPVIFLTGHGSIPEAVKAIKQGAVDFLTKPVDMKLLLERVAGAIQRNREEMRREASADRVAAKLASLTERESEILRLVVAGYTSKKIAQTLSISHRTVDVHRKHLILKLDVRSTLELIRLVEAHMPPAGAESPRTRPAH